MTNNEKDCPLSVSDWVNVLENYISHITSKTISILQILIALLAIFISIIYLAELRDNIVKNLFAGKITISMSYFVTLMVILILMAITGILTLVFAYDYIKATGPVNELLKKIIDGEDNSNVIRKEWREKNEWNKVRWKMKKWMKFLLIAVVIILIIVGLFYIFRGAIGLDSENGADLFFYVALPIIVTIIGTYSAPFFYNWYVYRFSKPKFRAHFKPANGKTFIERKVQEIELKPNKEQLVWVMIHNNGPVIKDNWFVNIDFEKGFNPVLIENTTFDGVDFQKRYTIQQKYNVAHFNSVHFSPLIPHDDTIIFPVVVKTPKEKKIYNLTLRVVTGDYSQEFRHEMKIKIL